MPRFPQFYCVRAVLFFGVYAKGKICTQAAAAPTQLIRPVTQRSSSLPATYQKIDCSHAVPYFSEDRCD